MLGAIASPPDFTQQEESSDSFTMHNAEVSIFGTDIESYVDFFDSAECGDSGIKWKSSSSHSETGIYDDKSTHSSSSQHISETEEFTYGDIGIQLSVTDSAVSELLELEHQLLSDNQDSKFTLETMLSPPSSCEGDVDCESLFPELTDIDVAGDSDGSNDYDYVLNTQESLESHNAVLPILPQSQPRSDTRPTKLGRPPKYAQLEPPCGYAVSGHLSKNAVLARENRRKKKEYIADLEKQVGQLKAEKTVLSGQLDGANCNIRSLKEEVEYLKSVIANETTIGQLLDHIPNSADLTIKRGKGKRPSTTTATVVSNSNKRMKSDHDYTTTAAPVNSNTSSPSQPGVCLHVAAGVVSLEFCKKCNQNSTSSSL